MLGVIGLVLGLQGIETPVSSPLPAGFDAGKRWRLVRGIDGQELPVQVHAGSAVWIDAVPAGGKSSYRLEAGEATSFPRVECAAVEGRHLTLRYEGKDILRYHTGVVPPPAGVDPAYAFTGYIHPVWTPSGRVITGDFAPKDEHHHGIWFAWRHAEFEGRKLNAWAPLENVGKVEFVKVEETISGPVFGGFRGRQRLLDPAAPGGPKGALDDAWDVKAFATRQARVFDLESTQTCAGDSSVTVLKYFYGGLGYRGPADWAGKQGVVFLTSEGKSRLEGNGAAAKWVLMNGKIDGKDAGFGLLGHPANFRSPQSTRLNPDRPFFCWVPGADAPFNINPGAPFVSRYRFIASDRTLTADEMDLHWAAYVEPSRNVQLDLR